MKEFNLTPQQPSIKITNKDKKRIFKRAYWMINGGSFDSETLTFSEALKRCWAELKAFKLKLVESFKSECVKIVSMYNVQPCINKCIEQAYNSGTNVNK